MVSVKKIVVAYDSSKNSQRALEWALHMAKQEQAELDIVMVLVPWNVSVDFNGTYIETETLELANQTMETKLTEARELCEKENVKVTTHGLFGNSADEILQHLETSQADMLVCGTRGFGTFKGLLLGSVAHRLVTYSKVPVMVVK